MTVGKIIERETKTNMFNYKVKFFSRQQINVGRQKVFAAADNTTLDLSEVFGRKLPGHGVIHGYASHDMQDIHESHTVKIYTPTSGSSSPARIL